MRSLIVILLFLFLLSEISCKKDKIENDTIFTLPGTTRTGQNTFGFLLDSVVFTNTGTACFTAGCRANLSCIYDTARNYITLSADKVLYKGGLWSTQENFDLQIGKVDSARLYSTINGDSIGIIYSMYKSTSSKKVYSLPDTLANFNIDIVSLDTANKILSGAFSGTLFRRMNDSSSVTSSSDSIIITEGRFDIKL